MKETIERESVEDRAVWIRFEDAAGELVDVTDWPVDVAFGTPRPEEWHPAQWVDGGPLTSPLRNSAGALATAYKATFEIGGPDTQAEIPLPVGELQAFVRITPTGEEPKVLPAGVLEVR